MSKSALLNPIGHRAACELFHKSRIKLKSQDPPALRRRAWQHLGRLILIILSSIYSAHLAIKPCYECCRLLLKVLKNPIN
jgi:hypothetical protein